MQTPAEIIMLYSRSIGLPDWTWPDAVTPLHALADMSAGLAVDGLQYCHAEHAQNHCEVSAG